MCNSDWQYAGDVNVEYGGIWIKLHNDYAEFVEITDLASAIGFESAVLIERGTVPLGMYWLKTMRSALDCVGAEWSELDQDRKRFELAYAMKAYGCYDIDEDFSGRSVETLITENDAEREFDGWSADKCVHSENLEGYIKARWLN